MIDRFFPFSGHNSVSVLLDYDSDDDDDLNYWDICLEINNRTLVAGNIYSTKDGKYNDHDIQSSLKIVEETRALGQRLVDFANGAATSLEEFLTK